MGATSADVCPQVAKGEGKAMKFLGTLFGAAVYVFDTPKIELFVMHPDDAGTLQFGPDAVVEFDERVPRGRMLAGTRQEVEACLTYFAPAGEG
jgi:hypothetical protein